MTPLTDRQRVELIVPVLMLQETVKDRAAELPDAGAAQMRTARVAEFWRTITRSPWLPRRFHRCHLSIAARDQRVLKASCADGAMR